MSSIFARALAGAGSAVASLAGRYIDEEMATNKARALADIDFENLKRKDAYEQSPERQATLRENARQIKLAQARTERESAVEGQQDTIYQKSLDLSSQQEATRKADAEVAAGKITAPFKREQGREDALAQAGTNREIAKASASDPDYLKAQGVLRLADPDVAARIAASKAQVNASNAHAGMLATQTAGLKLDIDDKKKLNALYDQASDILTNADLSDADRAKAFGRVQQQITLIKSKNGQGGTKDPELDTQTVVEKSPLPDGGERTVTRKEVRRKGEGGRDEADPLKAAMDKARAERAATQKAPSGPSAQPSPAADVSTPRKPDPVASSIEADMQPLVADYQQARDMYVAATKSQDPRAIARYQGPMNEALKALQQQARERLGNGADAFLAGL